MIKPKESELLKDRFSEITMMDSSREMVNATQEKIQAAAAKNMKSLFVDLEKEDFTCEFDIIYNQMALHHVCNIDSILGKFHFLLSKGGYLAIADLYKEDGSFHGEGFNGHNGFDIKTPHIIQLNKYPTTMIPAATIAKNTRRSLSVRTFLRMTASGNDSPMTAIMNASTVPIAAPLPSNACTIGIIPAAFEYIGTPIRTASGTDHQSCFPIIDAIKFSGT